MSRSTPAERARSWEHEERWRGVRRGYTAEDVARLQGSLQVEHTLARRGAERLWRALHESAPVRALGAVSGNQAIQQVLAALQAIYVSGWQVAADHNAAGQMYPDQSLYPRNDVPDLVEAINGALQRCDQLDVLEGGGPLRDWFAPIVADAEAGFGGPLSCFELTQALVRAGAAGVHFEDQVAGYKRCGHLGGKVLEPAHLFVEKLQAARLAADVLEVPAVLIARTDANSARLLTSDIDPCDAPFCSGERTHEGFYRYRGGIEAAVARGRAFAPYADLIWFETASPDLEEAHALAEGIHADFPGKLLAYNCSPSFNWSEKLGAQQIATFQRDLGALGYAFQFVTLAGFHTLNLSMFELATAYCERAMSAYQAVQDREFELASSDGYGAVRHQRFVGTPYFDHVLSCASGGRSSIRAMPGSTESDQF